MIKLTFCLRRRPGMSRTEFQKYWRGEHAKLVADRAEVLQIKRYVQVHTADVPGLHKAMQKRNGGGPEPYDGVAELWFDSIDDVGGGGPEQQKAGAELYADEKTFIDLANSPMWLSEEHVIVG